SFSGRRVSCQTMSLPQNAVDIARVRKVYDDVASSAASTKAYRTDLIRKLLSTNSGHIATLSADPRMRTAGYTVPAARLDFGPFGYSGRGEAPSNNSSFIA